MKKIPFVLNVLFIILLTHSLGFAIEITRHEANKKTESKNEVAICCVFKDEALWLKEWIEFHRLIGVDHFYLYNNLSSDHYLDILNPYIEKGIIDLYHYPAYPFTTDDQSIIYNHALSISRGRTKWLAIIDTDEFLNLRKGSNLKKYLNHFQRYAAVYPLWHVFGTSNVWSLGANDLLIEKLIYRAPSSENINLWGKSIVQPYLTLHSVCPHTCEYAAGFQVYYPQRDEFIINHYFVRTEEYLYTVKLERLKQWNSNAFTPQTLLEFMPTANLVEDRSMARFIPFLKKRLKKDKHLFRID